MRKEFRFQRCVLLFFLVALSVCSAQHSGPNFDYLDRNTLDFDIQESNLDSLVIWQERVVLHLASEQMGSDNLLFFKAYLLTGAQQNRNSFSGVLNVALVDGKGTVLKRQFHKVVDGMVEGHMEIPKNIDPGKYYLKAYTRWMQNYGEDFFALEDFWIGRPLSEGTQTPNMSEILISPEGGTLLSDHENRIIFKIPHSQATKAGQVGRILDDKRQEVATVNYYSTGIGVTIFKPIKDRLYQLELENGVTYPIPKAEIQGYLLQVNNLDENNAKIRITASSEVLGAEVTLVGTAGGIRYFENQLDFKDSNILDVDLSKRDIPYGIFTLKLVDAAGTELARRPIWVDGDRLHIDIKPISSNTGERAYRVKVTDKTNAPIKTQLALCAKRYEVGSARLVEEYSIDRPNLFTYPEFIGGNKITTDRKNRFLKDLNLLVSAIGLDHFSSQEHSFESSIKFPIQKGLQLVGYAYDLDNKLLANTEIQIMAQTEEEIWIRETETDANGLLRLEEIQINGNTELIFRTKGKDTKARLVKVIPLKEREQEKSSSFPNTANKRKQVHITENESLNPADIKPLINVDNTRLIELQEVEVNENRAKRQKYAPSVYGIDVPKHRIKYQDPKRPRSIGQMLSEIPGVIVSGDFNVSPSVTIPRGTGPVLWVLDGFPLPQSGNVLSLGGPVRSSISEIMNMISAVDIERIELLIGADAAMYGSRGSGGVFVIYTRTGQELEFISRKKGQLVFEGYEPILEFESYNKGLSKRKKEKNNLLYWDPNLETDENGEAIIKIPALSSDYQIKIEASTITPDGKRGSISINF